MKQVLIRKGKVFVEDVPCPTVDDHSLLVEVAYSLISSGTESAGLSQSSRSVAQRAIQQPQLVGKLIQKVKQEGLERTWKTVQGQLESGTAVGYSCSGIVRQIGRCVTGFQPGMAVACAGAGKANHAEMVAVPKNLVVPVPSECTLRDCASVALGSIALQGVRRCLPTLGESVVVLGLGLVGQLTAQLLKVSGARVIGFEPIPERVQRALGSGLFAGFSNETEPGEKVRELTGGMGADATIITAATASSELINLAMQLTRRKGRVVVVGDVGLELKRSPFYEKEIDLLISCSYGPGRYDPAYELSTADYPYAYVRWTENRNMEEYLRLLAEGRVDFSTLVDLEFPVEEAERAYYALQSNVPRPLAVVLRYPEAADAKAKGRTRVDLSVVKPAHGRIQLGVAGAGGFFRSTHLPNLIALSKDFQVRCVVSRNGHNALAVARQCEACSAATDYDELLSDPAIDAVFIATRHNLHASMVLKALHSGKHVFVEKPLAISPLELAEIRAFYSGHDDAGTPLLMTGFNRSFSPFIRRIRDTVEARRTPMILNYRMNAGHVPLDHWVHGEEGGGRNLGEACHIYHLLVFLTGSCAARVQAVPLSLTSDYYSPRDNFVVTLTFEEGSIASFIYTAIGSKSYPKEHLEVFFDGTVLQLADYRKLTIHGSREQEFTTRMQSKGHREELEAFAGSLKGDRHWPIPLWQQVEATRIALEVEKQLTGTD
ncbi:MAG: bi-domain-containing oxidoreductase [Acidobacteriota bacterium]